MKNKKIKPEEEICANCGRYDGNTHLSKLAKCTAWNTMFSYQPGPVQCVNFVRNPETELKYYKDHIWKLASTEFAHRNGVSWLGWCKRCGAEGCIAGAEHECYERVVTKKYRVGGTYRKSCDKEWLKRNS